MAYLQSPQLPRLHNVPWHIHTSFVESNALRFSSAPVRALIACCTSLPTTGRGYFSPACVTAATDRYLASLASSINMLWKRGLVTVGVGPAGATEVPLEGR
jgi:hypothetical protein